MRVDDDDDKMDEDDDEMDESDGKDGTEARSLVPVSRFTCNDIYLRYCFQVIKKLHVHHCIVLILFSYLFIRIIPSIQ